MEEADLKNGGLRSRWWSNGMTGGMMMMDAMGQIVPQATGQMVCSPHSDHSPPSIFDHSPPSARSSNFGTTPSPGSTLRNQSQNFSVPANGQSSSCAMRSPLYSNSSGSSPGQPPYLGPPPYSGNSPYNGNSTPLGGLAAYHQRRIPPNYGQSPPQFLHQSHLVMSSTTMTAEYGCYSEALDPVNYTNYLGQTTEQDFYVQAQTMPQNFQQQTWVQEDQIGAYNHMYACYTG